MRRADICVCLGLAVALAGCSRSEEKVTVTGEETVVKPVARTVETPKTETKIVTVAEKSPVVAAPEIAAPVVEPAPVVGELVAPSSVWKKVDGPAEVKTESSPSVWTKTNGGTISRGRPTAAPAVTTNIPAAPLSPSVMSPVVVEPPRYQLRHPAYQRELVPQRQWVEVGKDGRPKQQDVLSWGWIHIGPNLAPGDYTGYLGAFSNGVPIGPHWVTLVDANGKVTKFTSNTTTTINVHVPSDGTPDTWTISHGQVPTNIPSGPAVVIAGASVGPLKEDSLVIGRDGQPVTATVQGGRQNAGVPQNAQTPAGGGVPAVPAGWNPGTSNNGTAPADEVLGYRPRMIQQGGGVSGSGPVGAEIPQLPVVDVNGVPTPVTSGRGNLGALPRSPAAGTLGDPGGGGAPRGAGSAPVGAPPAVVSSVPVSAVTTGTAGSGAPQTTAAPAMRTTSGRRPVPVPDGK